MQDPSERDRWLPIPSTTVASPISMLLTVTSRRTIVGARRSDQNGVSRARTIVNGDSDCRNEPDGADCSGLGR